LWILWFGVLLTYYGMFLWIPSLLVTRGFDDVRPGQANVLLFLSTLAQVPGYFSAAWLVERWGRKPTLVLYLLGTAVSAFIFGNVGAGSDTANAGLVLLWPSRLLFFQRGAWGGVYTVYTER